MASQHVHTDACSADTCFKMKCEYWRSSGGVPVRYAGGRDFFHGPTIAEQQRKMVAEGKAMGVNLEPKTTVYSGPATV